MMNESIFFERNDLLAELVSAEALQALHDYRKINRNNIFRDNWARAIQALTELPVTTTAGYQVKDGVVITSDPGSSEHQASYINAIKSIMPWRRGPWNIAGQFIDSEWQSNQKFDQIKPLLEPIEGKRVIDIGSDNGYYAARIRALGADAVVCFDPSERCFLQFELFQKFACDPRIQFEPLGFKEAALLGPQFDIVLCMGVLYHHRSPLAVLEACRSTLKPGGKLILESMSYPSSEPVTFFPPDRYAKARNVYFVPSASAMVAMCKRSGFKHAELVSERSITTDEQRRTELAPFESLAEFLDPNDPTKTIEGWPAPHRAVVVASI